MGSFLQKEDMFMADGYLVLWCLDGSLTCLLALLFLHVALLLQSFDSFPCLVAFMRYG